jgi:hypothetical protein
MIFKCFPFIFAGVLDACFKCFICLQTYVASVTSGYFKIDRMLYLPPRFLLPRLDISSCQCWLGIRCAPTSLLDADDVRCSVVLCGREKR